MRSLDCRTAFVSDVHLGTRDCRADYLLDFLQRLDCERLVLAGDIFDLWAMRRRVCWTTPQTAVLEHVLALADRGVDVVYIPGNHDEALRSLVGSEIRGVRILRDLEHRTADGRRFLVSHGDQFDAEVRHSRLQHLMGDLGYQVLLRLGRWVDRLRRLLRLPYWSLSAWAKTRVGRARDYIGRFEAAAARVARDRGFDGHIVGHIHKAGIHSRDGVLYCNTGDWVEHCTALIEDHGGFLHLVHWSDHVRLDASDTMQTARNSQLPQLPPELAWLGALPDPVTQRP
ncbi:UDP-2,3-diacylglucosamine diphosphatase [Thioalkalivibrio paradoxus]|uniref:Ser/threonine protein phosphatase n=1 Tax=Thioalkalivibrio paradoxus ARh 1 TaxID=713585 RepID=W0DP74_9GAMM|nr:UDP-2,3-diacylglucosamine diphosphatase [Thioalkalivibrio paradoxus]AHE98793.1 ser/threonine protein phosphatase [Thioalkalivibrio paradoxus ARh 1]